MSLNEALLKELKRLLKELVIFLLIKVIKV
jgi:hypothetical protein